MPNDICCLKLHDQVDKFWDSFLFNQHVILTIVMSQFADIWGMNTRFTRNQILCNELEESKAISNLGARENVEELCKRIRYTLIYSYKIRNNKTTNCWPYKHSWSTENEKNYPRDWMNLKGKKSQHRTSVLSILTPQHCFKLLRIIDSRCFINVSHERDLWNRGID